jgi:hypothetical protein
MGSRESGKVCFLLRKYFEKVEKAEKKKIEKHCIGYVCILKIFRVSNLSESLKKLIFFKLILGGND